MAKLQPAITHPPLNNEDLLILGSPIRPEVHGHWNEGLLTMSGESYPDNPYEVFDAILHWVERYLSETQHPLRVELTLKYLNTSSVRGMIDIFDALQTAFEKQRDVEVKWFYDRRNPRSAELGGEFKEDYTFPFLIEPMAS